MRNTIVLVYSDTCFHCVNFMPVWEKFVQKNNKKLNCKKIKYSELANMKNAPYINGVPAVHLYSNNGKLIDVFDRNRTVKDLEKFVELNTKKKKSIKKKKSKKKSKKRS